MAALPYADIQGILLRAAKMPLLRYLVFRVGSAPAARQFIGTLVDGDGPRISSAEPWADGKPRFVLYVSFTYPGLRALGLSEASLSGFPVEYIEGAVRRAELVGDVGDSAPSRWKAKLNTDEAQIVVTIPATSRDVLEEVSAAVRNLASEGDACTEVSCLDAAALPPGDLAHFGYRDGIGQPTIAGGLKSALPSPAPEAATGAFLLGHPSQYEGLTYPVPQPDVLGRNGSFGALRVLEQDCAGFEAFLDDNASDIDRELLAAKLCGRWRNGVPLALSPDTPDPTPRDPVRQVELVRLHPDRCRSGRVRRQERLPLSRWLPHPSCQSPELARSRRQRPQATYPASRSAVRTTIRSEQPRRRDRARSPRHVHLRQFARSVRVLDGGLGQQGRLRPRPAPHQGPDDRSQ